MTEVWGFPVGSVAIHERQVHVWSVSLDQPPARLEPLLELLSSDERERAGRFRFAEDERRFIVARGVLRLLLGRYVDAHPQAIEIGYGPRGKPFAITPPGKSVRFNLAHSHELALYAFTRNGEVGVDLEFVRQVDDIDPIATRFFSRHEAAVLQALPANDRLDAFFRCWTRKEAYIKALGDGFHQPLDTFEVPLEASPYGRALTIRGAGALVDRWRIWGLQVAPGYEAALAIERAKWDLQPVRRVWLGLSHTPVIT